MCFTSSADIEGFAGNALFLEQVFFQTCTVGALPPSPHLFPPVSFPGLMPTRTMTPEQFHDILSLASSPPLTPSHPPPLTPSHPAPLPPSHPAPLTPSRPTLGKVEEGGEGEGESVVSSSAPSFAQVGSHSSHDFDAVLNVHLCNNN